MAKERLNLRRQRLERNERNREAALAALILERRILAITTFLITLALAIWVVAVSTDYWIVVRVDPEVVQQSIKQDNSSVKTRLLRSHSGLWRSCATLKRIENGSLSDDGSEGPLYVQTERIYSRCSSRDFDITVEDAKELKIDSTVASSLNDYRRTEISLAALSVGVMLMAVCFSIYTFRNPRYTFKRLAGGVNLLTAATVFVLIEVVEAAVKFEKQHLKQFYPNGSSWHFGFSFFISWGVFAIFVAAGLLFLIYSRKKKGRKALNDEMAMVDEAQIMGR